MGTVVEFTVERYLALRAKRSKDRPLRRSQAGQFLEKRSLIELNNHESLVMVGHVLAAPRPRLSLRQPVLRQQERVARLRFQVEEHCAELDRGFALFHRQPHQ